MSMRCDTSRASWLSSPRTGLLTWLPSHSGGPLLAKEVAATGRPAAAQVKHSAGCSVNDRESPWVTLLTGTWRARARLLAASPVI